MRLRRWGRIDVAFLSRKRTCATTVRESRCQCDWDMARSCCVASHGTNHCLRSVRGGIAARAAPGAVGQLSCIGRQIV